MGCTVLSVTETGNLTLAMVIFYLNHLSTLSSTEYSGKSEEIMNNCMYIPAHMHAHIHLYVYTCGCVGEKRLGNLLNEYFTVENVTSNNTLNDTFTFFWKKSYSSIVMKMMKRLQHICERYFSGIASYI